MPGVHRLELLANDLQRQVVVALRDQNVAQALDVLIGEATVAGGGALRGDQPLRLEEADLRDGHVREVSAKTLKHHADGHRLGGFGRFRWLRGVGSGSRLTDCAHWVELSSN